MNDKVTAINPLEDAKAKAKKIVAEEKENKAVEKLTKLYRELDDAQLIVQNIKREIEDAELAIKDGNV